MTQLPRPGRSRLNPLAHLLTVALVVVFLAIELLTLPRSAAAQGAPPLRVLILPRLIPDAISQMLPIIFDVGAATAAIQPEKISIVAMVYCGGDSTGNAYAVGVAVPGQAPALSSTAVAASDCTGSLSSTAARLMNSPAAPDWLEVIKLRAAWTPWRLTLSIADAASTARSGFSGPNLKAVGQIKGYDTSGIRILTGPGNNLAFDLALGFPGPAITLIVLPSGRVSNPIAYLKDPVIGGEIANAPAMSNVVADAQYTFINQVLRLYGSTFDIPIPIEGVADTMTARNIVVSGAENVMNVAGKLEYKTIDYDASVQCQGQDLTVSQVNLDAPGAACDQQDMMTRLQCEGQGVAMSGSSKALAVAVTSYYQGQPLHVSTRSQPLDFAIGETNYQATFEALKSSSHGGMFSEAGRASFRRANGS
jgi:hypothetical protein